MPEFVNPFSGMVPRKLNERELVRALRLSLAAEEEAVHLYEALADAADNKLAQAILQEIANEEKVHAGEFQRLLCILLKDEAKWLGDGAREVNGMAQKVMEEKSDTVEAAKGVPTIGDLKGCNGDRYAS
ncbi:MAG: ferritin family protein [Candidatus Bathyarchaeia archaeon]